MSDITSEILPAAGVGYLLGERLGPKQVASMGSILKKALREHFSAFGDKAFVVVTRGDNVQEILDLGGGNASQAHGPGRRAIRPEEMACVVVRPYRPQPTPKWPSQVETAAFEILPKVIRQRDFWNENIDQSETMPPGPSQEMLERARDVAAESYAAEAVVVPFEQVIPTAEGKAVYFETTASGRAAQFIRSVRQTAGLSQVELAAKLEIAQSRVAELEKGGGSQGPTLGLLERIATACGHRLKLAIE